MTHDRIEGYSHCEYTSSSIKPRVSCRLFIFISRRYRRREPETKSINPDELVIISCEKKCRNPATNEDLDSELYEASAITVDKSFYYHEGTITEKMTIDCM